MRETVDKTFAQELMMVIEMLLLLLITMAAAYISRVPTSARLCVRPFTCIISFTHTCPMSAGLSTVPLYEGEKWTSMRICPNFVQLVSGGHRTFILENGSKRDTECKEK